MMQKKNLSIIGIFIIIFFILMHFLSASDSQLIMACGGDNQTMIGCIGDNQTASFLSVGLIQPPSANQSNQSNVTTIIVNNIINNGGGGGGAGTTTIVTQGVPPPGFSVNNNELSVLLKQGQVQTQQFTVTNNQATPITILIQPSDSIQDFIKLSNTSITLNPGQSQTISIDFIAPSTVNPDLYVGELALTSNGTEVNVFTAINIESANPLLDVTLSLPPQYDQVSPGDTMLLGVTLYNLGSTYGDVSMEYLVQNESGYIILNQTDTVAIQTQSSFIKSLQIPSTAPLGPYTIYVLADYNDKVASASVGFQVVYVSINEKIYIIIIVGLSVIITGFIGFIIVRRSKKHYKQTKRVGIEDLIWR